MEKKEFIMVIKHFFDGKNTFKIQEWFEEYYKGSARQKQPFGDGLLNTNSIDAERSGHSNEAVTTENFQKIHKIVSKRIKVCQMDDIDIHGPCT